MTWDHSTNSDIEIEIFRGKYANTMAAYALAPCDSMALRWRHNGYDSVSNHQPHDCLLNRLFRRRLKKTSKLRVTGLCAGNSPGSGEFPAQIASNAENVSIWWRHHGTGNHDVDYVGRLFYTRKGFNYRVSLLSAMMKIFLKKYIARKGLTYSVLMALWG